MRKVATITAAILVAGTTALSGTPTATADPTPGTVEWCIERLVAGDMLESSARKACEEKYGTN